MQLARFLNKIFKKSGFILVDAYSKEYIIGDPGEKPIKLKILNNIPRYCASVFAHDFVMPAIFFFFLYVLQNNKYFCRDLSNL